MPGITIPGMPVLNIPALFAAWGCGDYTVVCRPGIPMPGIEMP